jgi:hypothetical protein
VWRSSPRAERYEQYLHLGFQTVAVGLTDYYRVLGVDPGADHRAIRSAYRLLARRYHPDMANGKAAAKRFLLIREAYEILSDPEKRREYDRLISKPIFASPRSTARAAAPGHRTAGSVESSVVSGLSSTLLAFFVSTSVSASGTFQPIYGPVRVPHGHKGEDEVRSSRTGSPQHQAFPSAPGNSAGESKGSPIVLAPDIPDKHSSVHRTSPFPPFRYRSPSSSDGVSDCWLGGMDMATRRMLLRSPVMFLMFAGVYIVTLEVRIASQFNRETSGARDPGGRGGPLGAGGPIAGLTAGEAEYFTVGKEDFEEVEDVAEGMGPRMNLDGCGGCHSQPAIGGTSPAVNPQVEFANKDGGTDTVPPFLSVNGPVREAGFVRNRDGSPDGGVHALFTITGRLGADGCMLRQPDFEAQLANRNVIFRIPTPVFGAGLTEQIPDSALLANQATDAAAKSSLGIRGRPNFHVAGRTISGQANNNGNDGTIARFGWKAQNKSLLLFSGEAYNLEMGITNELFQTEREETPACQYATVPNDVTNTEATTPAEALSAIEKFAFFMRFLDAPTPSHDTPGGAASIANGKAAFMAVGCGFCHTPTFTTGNTSVTALANKPVNLFSDLMLHDMGTGLIDGVSQGEAGGREFRTAPLWGVGQRIFFLHDGRTSDLLTAIEAHQSTGSEANGVTRRFLALSEAQKQDLLNFLRSL